MRCIGCHEFGIPYNVTHFDIFVTEKGSFESNFDDLQTSWSNETSTKSITKVKLDKTDPYFASLKDAYIISHETEISLKHLAGADKIPKTITSISRYYIYCHHIKRFLREPSKTGSHTTKDMLNIF